jgi:hypothetical protein
MLDFLSGVIASAIAPVEELGWEGTLIVLMFVGLCALAAFGISKVVESTERRPPTVGSRAVIFATKLVRAIIIFVATGIASLFGPRVPVILLVGLVALAVAVAIARKRGRGLWILRGWH